MAETIGTTGKVKIKFLDVFSEEKGDVLVTKEKIKVGKSQNVIEKDTRFSHDEKIEGVDFHILRYLDLVVSLEENDTVYHIEGVISQK
jgi:hypothetical protein